MAYKINNKTRGISFLITVMMLFSVFSGIPVVSASESEPAQTGKTGIDYTAADVIITGKINGEENKEYFINLTKETITVPSGYKIAAYSINDGKTWTAVSYKTVFDNAMLVKQFSKDTTLAFTDKYNTKTKKPATDATVVNFPKIKKRPTLPTYKINYTIGADPLGLTPGTWVLTTKSGNTSVKEGIEIAAMDSAGKKIDENGYGRFYGENGSANGIEIQPLPENGKAVSAYYYIRLGAADNGDGTYTVASSSRKITVGGQPKHGTYTVDKSKKTVRYNANTYVFKDDGSAEEPELMKKSGTLDVSDYNGDLYLWSAETSSAPASAMQLLTIDSTMPMMSVMSDTVSDLSETDWGMGMMAAMSIGLTGVSVTIANPTYELYVGDSYIFTAVVGGNSSGADLLWSVDDATKVSVASPSVTTAGVTHTKEITGLSPGTVTITVRVLDDLTASDTVTIEIKAKPVNSVIITSPNVLTAGEVGVPYSYPLAATVTSASTAPIKWSTSDTLPAGFALNEDTGIISSVNPTVSGTFSFTIKATSDDTTITPASKLFSITINPVTIKRTVMFLAPNGGNITAAIIGGGAINSPSQVPVGASVRFTAVPDPGYRVLNWTLNGVEVKTTEDTPQTLKTLTYSVNVVSFTGTPPDPGIMVHVYFEEIPPESTKTITFEVLPDPNNGVIGATLSASGGTVTENTSLTNRSQTITIPDVIETMVFTSTPRPVSDGEYIVKGWTRNGTEVKDSGGSDPLIDRAYTVLDIKDGDVITVQYASVEPSIIKTVLINGRLLVDGYSDTLTASGNGPFTWVWTANAGQELPPGLTLNTSTGVISGKPGKSGEFKFDVTVKDRFNKTDTKEVKVYIAGEYQIFFGELLSPGTTDDNPANPYETDNNGGTLTAQIGSGVINSGTVEQEGVNITFAAQAKPGYAFKEWKIEQLTGGKWINGTMAASGLYRTPDNTKTSYTLENLRSDLRVSAIFQPVNLRVVEYSVIGGNGQLSSTVENKKSVTVGTDVTFTAKPNVGFQVKEWIVDGSSIPGNKTNSYTITVPEDAAKPTMIVTVEFEATPPAQQIEITTPVILPDGRVHDPYNLEMTVSNPSAFARFAWELSTGSTLPAGLTLNRNTGIISGTPETTASSLTPYSFTVKVTGTTSGGAESVATKTFSLIVNPPIPVTGVTLNKTAEFVSVNRSETLIATVAPANANKKVTWTSSDASVATVDSNGKVTGIAPGTATITVTTVALRANGTPATATCQITVSFIAVENITNVPATGTVGIPLTLTGLVNPGNASNQKIEWYKVTGTGTSQTVESILNGVLNVAATGAVKVRAVIKNGKGTFVKPEDYSQDFTVNFVAFVAVTNITGVPASTTAGTDLTLTGTVAPNNATFKSPITWSVVNNGGATGVSVANGNVLKTPGTLTSAVTVTVRATITNGLSPGADYTKNFNITVNPILATGLTLNKSTLQLALGSVGNTETLVATILPAAAASKTLNWSSSNQAIASVDSAGKVTARGVGTATITVKTTDGSNKSATCTVTVAAEPVKPTIVTGSLPEGTRTVSYRTTLTATGTTPVTWEEVLPAGATNSSLPGGLMLASNGVISGTPDTKGTFTFRVRAKNIVGEEIKTFRIEIFDPINVTGINLHADATIIAIGETTTVRVNIFPVDATNKNVIWNTTNAGIADIDANGLITAKSVGTVTITAMTVDGGLTGTCAVTIINPPIDGITLNQKSVTLPIGGSEVLLATVYPTEAANRAVTWTSSNPSVATVNAGSVIAVAQGTATIMAATSDGNYVATCAVTVTVPVSGVSLNKTSVTIYPGDRESLTETVLPTNATNKAVTWISSDRTVATVDDYGTVMAISPGRTNITVTSADGGLTAVCAVTVDPIVVTSVTLSKNTARIAVGESETLTATVAPINATNKAITWSSSNASVATVDSSGRVTARSAGDTTITVTSLDGGGLSASCAVTVYNVSVAGITMKTSANLGIGESETLVPAFSPANATNKNLTWNSSNTSAVIVDANGVITGKSEGTANVTVITADGGYTATCVVKVSAGIPASGISLNKTSVTLIQGATERLTATITPADVTNKNITWSSSNASVAEVDASGLVTAKAPGSATITAKTADGNKSAACVITVDGIFNITVTQSSGGTARASATEARPGTVITLAADVNDGYYASWRISPSNVVITGHMFLMPASNVVVTPVYNRIPLISEYADPNSIDAANYPSYNLRIDGAVSIPAKVLKNLERVNPDFTVDASTSYGTYKVPANFASIISGLGNTLAPYGLGTDDITFNFVINDRTWDPAVLAAFERDMPDGVLWSATEFGVDIARLHDDKVGSAISPVDSFTERVTRLIPIPAGLSSIPNNWGVFRYNEMTGHFEFVPHTTQVINGIYYAVVHSTTNGIYVIAEHTVIFTDVLPGMWYTIDVEKAGAKRLVLGIGNSLYAPDRSVTRAEFVQMITNALQLPKAASYTRAYGDVPSTEWYYDAIMKSRSAGLLDKLNGDAFYPNQPITREEMSVILAAVARREGLTTEAPPVDLSQIFSDYLLINANYLEDVELVYRLKITNGVGGGMYSPKGTTTRAQAAAVQIRLLELLGFLG